MGQVFGINGVKEPAYSLIWHATPFEVRHYPAYFVAQVACNTETGSNTAFRQLADYIGVFGTPKNSKSKCANCNAITYYC